MRIKIRMLAVEYEMIREIDKYRIVGWLAVRSEQSV